MKIYVRTVKRTALMIGAATALALGPVFLSPASAAGGSFKAFDTGTFKIVSCSPGQPCVASFTGAGAASFLGPTKETASIQFTIKIPCSPAQGLVRFTSTTSSTNAISAEIGGKICLQTPITKGLLISMGYKFIGGTGAFAHASGTGVISGTAILKTGAYTDTWSGSLNY